MAGLGHGIVLHGAAERAGMGILVQLNHVPDQSPEE